MRYHTAARHAAAGECPHHRRARVVNQTQTYRIGQLLTRDVVRELIGRTKYHVLNQAGDSPTPR